MVEALGAPVCVTPQAVGQVPADHPLFVGVRGDQIAHYLNKSDVILAVGSSLSPGRFSHGIPDAAKKTIILCNVDELHINNLAVAPGRRRQGVGSALLQHVLREGTRTGAARATLEVRESNEIALALYERFGFTVAGVRRAYYSNPSEDALVLWKEKIADG